jgi:hypothetical protein
MRAVHERNGVHTLRLQRNSTLVYLIHSRGNYYAAEGDNLNGIKFQFGVCRVVTWSDGALSLSFSWVSALSHYILQSGILAAARF